MAWLDHAFADAGDKWRIAFFPSAFPVNSLVI
jgi:hypothetical protein